ncbi:YisL family protein [Caldibacillus thermolactis]|jgi:hypothetical protein|uniref:UPF0344 protein OEV82_10995 n=1 Tax=Pallidibacillus thermolactis TaxID=251051 RepID=A0ABT2WHE1_9BACI|nr:YisL family protein [Pallidibacillus thermolactis]MCU9594965.1 YisL family protein [Pallidibacillus thermolactis]MCU9601843.1 YisL family protein [Pallidibacillus thermolactis subsp. kokeshiiformis]MED1674045.1 YisL family protein [Pallidibacillus thermolactis subsp. kokeshiiformis]
MTHMHITSWVLAIILFIVTLVLMKMNNEKGAKIVSMITRLFYIFVLVTGVMLFMSMPEPTGDYHIKMLAGVLVIVMMELLLVATKKQRSTVLYWILFIIILLTTIYLGLKLPMGMKFF